MKRLALVRRPARLAAVACLALPALALLAAAPSADAATRRTPARRTARSASAATRPDAALYREAQAAEARLRGSARRLAKRPEWEMAILRYRKVIARYPRSGYCDNALLAIGKLYRDMGRRFSSTAYRDDALQAYRAIVSEYPSSSLGDDALWAAVEITKDGHDRRRLAESARAYLDTYPEGRRASRVKKLLRQREPATPLPSPPPPGLASVFDLRAWSGETSTRVVVDLERKVPLQSDRARDPDRLWVDLIGARLHPNLEKRVFPVGDGLLERVRIGKNREDVVRIVLDFKDVWEHQMFYLDNPTRLVIDVRGQATAPPPASSASASPTTTAPPQALSGAAAAPVTATTGPPAAATLPVRRVSGLLPAGSASAPPAAPIVLSGVDRLPGTAAASPPASARQAGPPDAAARRVAVASALPSVAPEPPAANRAGSYSLARQLGLGARRIVIDAGHGGHDPGTIGRGGLQEKDLVLDVALRLERLVRQELGTEVVLTRATDVFIPLEERTAIANSRGADLFLSIHANASRNPGARGIETYFLNFARNAHAEAVAARENAISPATLKDLQSLVKAITLNSKIDESRDFAAAVQENMVSGVRAQHAVLDRGVHTAPFYVLIGANMPAVLAEIAFVSNPEEERRLKSPDYRETLARSLLRGVRSYLESLNRTQMRQLTEVQRRPTVAGGRGGR
ncbi:MAG: N-acetylmuramoyl-L-alanine amidase [Betaproteobacteria bacterium]